MIGLGCLLHFVHLSVHGVCFSFGLLLLVMGMVEKEQIADEVNSIGSQGRTSSHKHISRYMPFRGRHRSVIKFYTMSSKDPQLYCRGCVGLLKLSPVVGSRTTSALHL